MKFKLSIAATAILAVSFVASYGQTSATNPPAKKHVATAKTKEPARPTVEEQIQALRHDLERPDQQPEDRPGHQGRAVAEGAAGGSRRPGRGIQGGSRSFSPATGGDRQHAAVTTLQSTVTDLKGSQATLATKVSDETAKIKKDIANPSACCTTRASTSRPAASWRVKLFTAPRPPAATFPPPSVRFPTRARTPIR
jgi:hypothetical protein